AEARPALLIAAGTAPWLVLAGLVEGYASRVGLSLWATAAIGLPLGTVFWALLFWRGRPGRLTAPSRVAQRQEGKSLSFRPKVPG
ncbi:MAG: hypothetical protein WB239_13085, partial [Acidimicrobiia bacterium]